MGYLFPIVMLASGLILLFVLSKENKIFRLAGAYFVVLAAWAFADLQWPQAKVFGGAWGIAFRVVTGLVLVALVVVFVKEYRKKGRDAAKEPKEPEKPEDPGDGLF